MAIKIRGRSDRALTQVKKVLSTFTAEHPKADIVIYRYSPVSIRIRIIDSVFAGVSRADRHETVWTYLEALNEEVLRQVAILLLLAPKETKKSFANVEFDNPVPSEL